LEEIKLGNLSILAHINKDRNIGLDLMRAVAIMLVLGAHSFHIVAAHISPTITTIFLPDGVDLFFVLSGFLVGRIWIKKMEQGDVSFNAFFSFYKRRWFRTVPVYWFVILVLAIGRIIVSKGKLDFPWHYFVFIQNLFQSEWDPYFFYPEAWSLSIEEWFYVLMPLATIFLLKVHLSKKNAVLIFGLTIVFVPLILRLILFFQNDYTTLDDFHRHVRRIVVYRLDAIGWGVLGAWISHYLPSLWSSFKKNYAAWLFLFIVISIFAQPSSLQIPFLSTSYFTLLSALLMLLLPKIQSISIASIPVRNTITTISILSYSLYLVNRTPIYQTLFFPLKSYSDGSLAIALVGYVLYYLLSFVAAYIFYRLVEKPFTDLRERF
jgi:peptidoglycan/LPS O-acetylase OafA/YrhL